MDFEADAEKEGMTPDQLDEIILLAQEQVRYEEEVTRLDDELKEAKKDLKGIQEFELPHAMEIAGVKKLSIDGVGEVSYKEDLKCAITKDNALHAFKWLRDNNHGTIIKNEIIIRLGVGEEKKLEAVHKVCEKLNLALENKSSVHNATLKAFLKEKKEQGTDLPEDLFGIFEFKTAKVKGE